MRCADGRDVVVVTIPQKNIPDLPAGLFEGEPEDLVVVDTGNYYPQQRDGRIEAIEAGFFQKEIAEASYRYQRSIETKERVIVGVNAYITHG